MSAASRISGPQPDLLCPSPTQDDIHDDNFELATSTPRAISAGNARTDLAPGFHTAGPAIIEEYSSTTVVYPSFDLSVDAHGNLRLQGRE